jgi:hypothetical protein
VRSSHLRRIGSFDATAHDAWIALEMPCVFGVLQLQRLESRMSWNAAPQSPSATVKIAAATGGPRHAYFSQVALAVAVHSVATPF